MYQSKTLPLSSILVVFAGLRAVTSAATEVVLPRPGGPFSVGTKAIEIMDPQRKMFRDENPRRWMIQAFFPKEGTEQRTYPYMPGTLENGHVLNDSVLAHADPSAKISKAGPFPVIFFLHGLGNVRQSYTILCEEIASHGYVVLSFDEPYVASYVGFPDGTKVTITFHDSWYLPRDRDFRYQFYDDAMHEAIADFRFALDHLSQLNTKYFSGMLSPSAVVTMGHSFGGNVAHTFGFEDGRVRAVLDVDSKITDRKIYGRLGVPPNPQKKPVLFIRGTKQYQEAVGDSLQKIENSEIKNFDVQHSAFHDNAFLARKIQGMERESTYTMLWTWFFKTGPHFDPVDTDLGGLEADTWFRQLNGNIVSWLSRLRKVIGTQ